MIQFSKKEIFSIYKGFRATLKSRELSFNKTYLDLAEALDQPPYKGETLSRIKDYILMLKI